MLPPAVPRRSSTRSFDPAPIRIDVSTGNGNGEDVRRLGEGGAAS